MTSVRTESGMIRGKEADTGNVHVFKGIPFAAPPIGDLRWRAPKTVEPWDGVRPALQFGAMALGATAPGPARPGPPQSEDCLTLNVWTLEPSRGAGLPVMVWLHGGGFAFGGSALPMYEGRNMAARGVVVVTLNYRLGVFGFLAHPELDAEQYGSGAFGLLDQLAALRWVQSNISAFGGNPGNVSLWGESAGAHSIGILMASSGTAGLFQKAIIQSGAFWDSPRGSIPQHDDALARGVALGKRLGDLDLSSLRSLPAAELNHLTSWDFKSDPGVTAFGPSIDGALLQDSPAAVFERGEQLRIPVLGGWNTVEDLPFRPRALPHSNPEAFYDAAARLFNEAQLSEFKTCYPAADPESAMQSAFKLVGDLVITEQTWTLLKLQQKILPAQTYVYEFSFSSAYSPVPAHVAEVPFVFGTFTPQYYAPQSPPADDGDRAISDKMMSYWSNFAGSGNPNSGDLPYWPAFASLGTEVMKFNTGNIVASQVQSVRLDFVAGLRKRGRYPEHWRN